jgi:hypothetical protein
MTGALLLVHTNAVEGRENEFDDWYTNTHIPEMLALPSVAGATRFKVSDSFVAKTEHRYLTMYELNVDPDEALAEIQRARSGMTWTDAIGSSRGVVVEPLGERMPARRPA